LSPFIRTAHIVAVAIVVAAQQINDIFDAPLIALAFFAAGITIAALYGWIAYHWTGFHVTTEQIALKTGVLFRQHRRIPTDRIEAIDIARPLIARMFDLVELRVEVVSGGGSEMRFQYLDQEDATALREFVLQLQNNSDTPIPTSTPSDGDVRIALEVPAIRILMAYGIARIALTAFIAMIFVAAAFVTTPAVAVSALLFALPIMLAIAITTFKVVENYWGFRVSYDERGMIVRRGFLNELTQKVPIARIQGIRIEEPLLWRQFGYARISVDVAGYRNSKVDGASESAVLAPVAKWKDINTLLKELIGTLDIDSLERVAAPRRARWRAPITYRFLSIAGNDKWAITRHGFIRRRTDVIAHTKAQSIRVTQGPWQRKLDLATLHIDTAGNGIRFHAVHRDAQDAYELAWLSRKLST
jgi:putative membrane protein